MQCIYPFRKYCHNRVFQKKCFDFDSREQFFNQVNYGSIGEKLVPYFIDYLSKAANNKIAMHLIAIGSTILAFEK